MKFNTYQKVAITTVGATIFLIFVGGLVRATGSGLGCPDWPTCFGMWIPPTSAAELPAGYDPGQFNVLKTWTEYLNRLTGVVIGLLITATCLLSFRYRKTKPSVVYSSVAAFILVLVQGWLGGRVVETGLNEWLITIHMILAMVLMSVLLYATFKATEDRWVAHVEKKNIQRWLFGLGMLLFVITLYQMVLGTEVREAVDRVGMMVPRGQWLAQMSIDELHRAFSWAVFLSGVGLFVLSRRKTDSLLLWRLSTGIMVVIVAQIALGAGLYYLGMPPAYQVLHLLGIAILICLEFLFILLVKPSKHRESAAGGLASGGSIDKAG